jgi:hypothetical protein
MNFFLLFFFKMVFVISLCSFFSLKHCELLQCFPTWFLFCYSVSHMFFFKIIFVEFFFNIELVENSTLTFPTCFFLFFFQNCHLLFFLCFFFQNCFCRFYFFELVQNLASFFKTLWIATVFPHMIFFVMIFFKIIFIGFIIFNIELIENYNCRFPHETL